ncbi:hypothetical protein TCAL_15263 [Tigriopus californicus]|uniref:Uncharacterized protein n=1 Tax=Tigriopus californicus TaxID=6832 RepID=A0A553NEZ3_TIGCA|nr:hypothetical protein TCAL_15263 [Tigriopus californicus]
MPGSVPYSISSEGGTTVRLTTTEGNVTTAQLVSVPSGVLQGIQNVPNGGGGGSNVSVAVSSAPNSHNSMTAALPSWILDGSGIPPAGHNRGNPTSADTTNTTVIIQQGEGVQPDSIVTVEDASQAHSAVSSLPMIATSLDGHQGAIHVRKADEEAAARELLQLKTMPMAITKDLTNGYVLVPADANGHASSGSAQVQNGHQRLIMRVPELGLHSLGNHSTNLSSISIPNLDGNITDEGSDSEDEDLPPTVSSKSSEPASSASLTISESTSLAKAYEIPNNKLDNQKSGVAQQGSLISPPRNLGLATSSSRTVIVSSPASKLQRPVSAPKRHSIKSLLGVDDDSSDDEVASNASSHESRLPLIQNVTDSGQSEVKAGTVLDLCTKTTEDHLPSATSAASAVSVDEMAISLVQSKSIPSSSIDYKSTGDSPLLLEPSQSKKDRQSPPLSSLDLKVDATEIGPSLPSSETVVLVQSKVQKPKHFSDDTLASSLVYSDTSEIDSNSSFDDKNAVSLASSEEKAPITQEIAESKGQTQKPPLSSTDFSCPQKEDHGILSEGLISQAKQLRAPPDRALSTSPSPIDPSISSNEQDREDRSESSIHVPESSVPDKNSESIHDPSIKGAHLALEHEQKKISETPIKLVPYSIALESVSSKVVKPVLLDNEMLQFGAETSSQIKNTIIASKNSKNRELSTNASVEIENRNEEAILITSSANQSNCDGEKSIVKKYETEREMSF